MPYGATWLSPALAFALVLVGTGCKDRHSRRGHHRCKGLSYCDCRARPECRLVSKGCLCPCEHKCPGFESCECACGGGKYFGCAKAKPKAKAKTKGNAKPKRNP